MILHQIENYILHVQEALKDMCLSQFGNIVSKGHSLQ